MENSTWTLRHSEYSVMPVGLTNTPAVFQALITDVVQVMLNRCLFVYLNDILSFSRDLQEHHRHVKLVLWLLENRLFKAENQ